MTSIEFASFSTTMTITIPINDPAWWPIIKAHRLASYFMVAAFIGVTYDWALTFGQEVELIWRQRWSQMTVLYLSVRYLGILYAILNTLNSVPTISLTDTVSFIIYVAESWMVVLVVAMLSVIIIIRLHAMYQRSRKILIFLIVTFLANNIFDGVVAAMITMHTSGEELTAFGAYLCSINYAKDIVFLISLTWILCIVWEIFALCLAVWVAVKHFRELRRHSAGGMIGDCFKVLMKSHVVYSANFAAAFCFQLIASLPQPSSTNLSYLEIQIYSGLVQILMVVQMSVLGPRLILGVREYHAKLVADSDAVTVIPSIAFQERTHISTISSSG